MLIALALDFVPDATARAVSHAQKAKEVLLLKIAELEKTLNGEGEKEEKEKAKREVEDIKSLMGDVDMKVRLSSSSFSPPFPTSFLLVFVFFSLPSSLLSHHLTIPGSHRSKTSALSPSLPSPPPPTPPSKPSFATPCLPSQTLPQADR
jgi:hypothetical protein